MSGFPAILAGMGQVAEQEQAKRFELEQQQRELILTSLRGLAEDLAPTDMGWQAQQLLLEAQISPPEKPLTKNKQWMEKFNQLLLAKDLYQRSGAEQTKRQSIDDARSSLNVPAIGQVSDLPLSQSAAGAPFRLPPPPGTPPSMEDMGAEPSETELRRQTTGIALPPPPGGASNPVMAAAQLRGQMDLDQAVRKAEAVALAEGRINAQLTQQEREGWKQYLQSVPGWEQMDVRDQAQLLTRFNLPSQAAGPRPTAPRRFEAMVGEAKKIILEHLLPTGETVYTDLGGQLLDPSSISPTEPTGSSSAFGEAKRAKEQEIGRPLTSGEIVDLQRSMASGSFIPLMTERGVIEGVWNPQRGVFERPPAEVESPRRAPLSETATENIANAQSGLRAINKIRAMIKKDPTVLAYAALPGSLGAREFEAARREVTDIITRLRTGAALNQSEEAFYKRQLPTLLDLTEPSAIEAKLAQVEGIFRTVVDPSRTRAPFLEPPSGNEDLTNLTTEELMKRLAQ